MIEIIALKTVIIARWTASMAALNVVKDFAQLAACVLPILSQDAVESAKDAITARRTLAANNATANGMIKHAISSATCAWMRLTRSAEMNVKIVASALMDHRGNLNWSSNIEVVNETFQF